MKQYIPVLKKTLLFSGVGDDEIESMLSCLRARLCHYKKMRMFCGRGSI